MTEDVAIEKVYSPSLYGVYTILLVKKEVPPETLSDKRLSIDGISYKTMGEVNRLRARFTQAGNLRKSTIKLIGREVKRGV